MTLEALCARYMADVAPTKRPNTQGNLKWAINAYILPLLDGGKQAHTITHNDIVQMQAAIKSPSSSNWVVGAIRAIFTWANEQQLLETAAHLKIRLAPMPKRRRYLSPEEYDRVIPVLESHPHKTATGVIKLIILTGCRLTESRRAMWTQFDDLNDGRTVWTKPAATVKQKRDHIAPISQAAAALLKDMKALAAQHGVTDSPYVFPCLRTNTGHYDSKRTPHDTETEDQVRLTWTQICVEANIKGVLIHDIRHSFASVLVNKGLSLPVIGGLLGHARPDTTNRYAHLYDATTRAATEVVAASILNPQRPP